MLQVVLDCFIFNLSLPLKIHLESLYFAHFLWAYRRCSAWTLLKRDIWSKVQLSEQHETEVRPHQTTTNATSPPTPIPLLSRASAASLPRHFRAFFAPPQFDRDTTWDSQLLSEIFFCILSRLFQFLFIPLCFCLFHVLSLCWRRRENFEFS